MGATFEDYVKHFGLGALRGILTGILRRLRGIV
jgi:hypothetical protein